MIDAPKYTEIKAEEQYDKIVVKKIVFPLLLVFISPLRYILE